MSLAYKFGVQGQFFAPELINVYGCGGTGSWLVQSLALYLASRLGVSSVYPTLRMIDGDTISQSNLTRQNFNTITVGKSKVDVLKRVYQSTYPNIQTVPEYLYPEYVANELALYGNRRVINILSVDDMGVRRMILDMMDNYTNDYFIFTPGNEQYGYTVTTFGRVGGTIYGNDPRLSQPALQAAAPETIIRRDGCTNANNDEQRAQRGTQLYATNHAVSHAVFKNLSLLLETNTFFAEIYGDIRSGERMFDAVNLNPTEEQQEEDNAKDLESVGS